MRMLLLLSLCVSLAACSGFGTPTESTDNKKSDDADSQQVGTTINCAEPRDVNVTISVDCGDRDSGNVTATTPPISE